MMRSLQRLFLITLAVPLLGACAETQLAFHAAKSWIRDNDPDGNGIYKVGTPYRINGIWYYPAQDYNYVETGIASWYGPKFNHRRTANGELFDMNRISAAHRTLPLPSLVQVTNLENGRSIRVRVNDRGPFAHNRIIDMSRRGAQLLGFSRKGTARVRVRILAQESRQLAALYANPQLAGDIRSIPRPDSADTPGVTAAPRGNVTKVTLSGAPVDEAPKQAAAKRVRKPEPGSWQIDRDKKAEKEGGLTQGPAEITDLYVQAGAFADFVNANRMKRRLSSFGRAEITGIVIGKQHLYRVRIGPLRSLAGADRLLAKMINAGIPSARITLDR